MNLEVLQDHINAFNREIIDSGFKRDLDDYANSLPSLQNNIVSLREIAGKISATLSRIYSGDLPERLSATLPKEKSPPFTASDYDLAFKKLVENTEIQQPQFVSQFQQLLASLRTEIQQDAAEIKTIEDFIAPYLVRDSVDNAKKEFATISIVFKEEKTISSLTQLTKTFAAWNRTIPIYHELIKSESPKDIEVVEIQNGSIDLIVHLDVKVAASLAELFKVGFLCYGAYLSYKTMVRQI